MVSFHILQGCVAKTGDGLADIAFVLTAIRSTHPVQEFQAPIQVTRSSDLTPFPTTAGESILRLIAKVLSRPLNTCIIKISVFQLRTTNYF